MDFSSVMPRTFHPFLRWLGRLDKEWLEARTLPSRLTPDGMPRTGVWADIDLLRAQKGAEGYTRDLNIIQSLNNGRDMLSLVTFEACAVALAKGPKVFKPTAEQFESMRHVDVNVPTSNYRQPYPALVVLIPGEARRALAVELNMDPKLTPEWILTRQRFIEGGTRNSIFAMMSFPRPDLGLPREEVCYYFQDREEFTDMEAALKHHYLTGDSKPSNHLFAEAVGRATINLNLMLVHYGHKIGQPLQPKEYDKHRGKKGLEHLAAGDFRTVEMMQEVTVRRVERKRSVGEPTGIEMPPHWRRGHWRNQACGKDRAEHKMVFIQPVLVRADRTVGDVSESTATYTLK